MSVTNRLRIADLDRAVVEQAYQLHERLSGEVEATIQLASATQRQLRYNVLGGIRRARGLLAYALGRPIAEVRQEFAAAAVAYLTAFSLREQAQPFPVQFVATGNGLSQALPADASTSPDYSATNSRVNLLHVYLALAAGDWPLAGSLAALIWDPPGAAYVAERSVLCTPQQQQVAYAVREYFRGIPAAARALLKSPTRTGGESEAELEGQLLSAILQSDREWFTAGLVQLLTCHREARTHGKNRSNPLYHMCLPAVGLCSIALRERVIDTEAIPLDVFLPPEFVQGTSPRAS